MVKKQDFSRKILEILSEKQAISLPDLKKKMLLKDSLKHPEYAINRSLKSLKEAGLVEALASGQGEYARLTEEGKKRVNTLRLDSKTAIINPNWDGKWRIILLDLPENRKAERESLRYLLKKAGFVMLKNSAWISPYPFEHLFTNIKKDLGLTSEIMIIVTESIDTETELTVKKYFS